MASSNQSIRFIQLANENELRILVGEQSDIVRIELTKGKAEIFGTQMEIGQLYTFPSNSSVSVYTWHDCEVKIIGNVESCEVVRKNQHMILNTVLHAVLEERRSVADENNSKGPRILVVGPIDVGKSTLCRFLLNYAARMGRKPLFIDLDVGQNAISIPGTIGVVTIDKPASISFGFDERPVQVYQFGYKSPGRNLNLYFTMIKKLGQIMKLGLQSANQNMLASGVIINSCGWVRGDGYKAITHAAMVFEIDILCVIGEEKLHFKLKQDMPSCVEVMYMPRLEGVAERSQTVRWQTRDARVREYFYGPTNLLSPFSFEVNYSDVQVLRAHSSRSANNDSSSGVAKDLQIISIPLGPDLVNRILAVSSADVVNEDIFLTHVIGFVCVTDVYMAQRTMKVLSPQPSPLPKNILIMGDVRLNQGS